MQLVSIGVTILIRNVFSGGHEARAPSQGDASRGDHPHPRQGRLPARRDGLCKVAGDICGGREVPPDDSIILQVRGSATAPVPPPQQVRDADPAFGPRLVTSQRKAETWGKRCQRTYFLTLSPLWVLLPLAA